MKLSKTELLYCWRCYLETGMLWRVYESTNTCQYCEHSRIGWSACTKEWLRRWVKPKPYPPPKPEAPVLLPSNTSEPADWRYRKPT